MYDFLFTSHIHSYFLAETCSCYFLFLQWSCAITGMFLILLCIINAQWEFHTLKVRRSWYIVWNFGSVGYWKYYGLALSDKDLREKKLKGNEFGEIHTAAL